ncbi:alpha/beta hydrolase [Micromonospora sp. NPDC051296]|uniref:alpha/beta hydrolase n=1 Tax=Micromonospora sp. NPDC051296 TaxID=3155046 RepID=UPI00343800DB
MVGLITSLATAPAAAQNSEAAATLPETTITNIAFTPPVPANTQGNRLDLFLPERAAGKPVPLLIWTSGSAWTSDTGKTGASTWANQLRPLGFAVAGVSIRSSSQVKFPGQLHDIKAAIRWLRHNADEYGLDPSRFAIAGNSSGGWTATMAGVTGGVSEELEGTTGVTGVSSRVQAVVDFYGPTNFQLMDYQERSIIVHDSPTSPESQLIGCAIQTCPELTQRANPVNYVSADDPPFLIFHGTADNLVPHGQSRILYEAMRANCHDATFHSVPGAGHAHSYLGNTSQAQNQTVFKSLDCAETITQGFTGGTEPNYAYIADFLHRAFVSGEVDAPVTTAKLTSDAITGQGWYVKAVVSLTAEDGWGSGVATTEYRVNNGKWTTYNRPVKVDGNGERLFEYRSIDRNGNVEETKVLTFRAVGKH